MRIRNGNRDNGWKARLNPDGIIHSARELDIRQLKKQGITLVICDIDHTLRDVNQDAFHSYWPEKIRELQAAGLDVVAVSNNFLPSVRKTARQAELPAYFFSCKPLPFVFHRVARDFKRSYQEMAIVGDQLFTDILGGNTSGLQTILVLSEASFWRIDQRMNRWLVHRWFLKEKT